MINTYYFEIHETFEVYNIFYYSPSTNSQYKNAPCISVYSKTQRIKLKVTIPQDGLDMQRLKTLSLLSAHIIECLIDVRVKEIAPYNLEFVELYVANEFNCYRCFSHVVFRCENRVSRLVTGAIFLPSSKSEIQNKCAKLGFLGIFKIVLNYTKSNIINVLLAFFDIH